MLQKNYNYKTKIFINEHLQSIHAYHHILTSECEKCFHLSQKILILEIPPEYNLKEHQESSLLHHKKKNIANTSWWYFKA